MSKNDGGPAFPRQAEDGPHFWEPPRAGMSLRDWFAGQALVGLVAHTGSFGIGHGPEDLAKRSVQIADAMIEHRSKE